MKNGNGHQQQAQEPGTVCNPRWWGWQDRDFLALVREKEVELVTNDQRAYRGKLVGSDVYTYVVQIGEDLVMISKASVKLMRPLTAPKAAAQ